MTSGVVVAVGKNVTRFKANDAVFGTAPGSFAEYALASQHKIVLKPADLSFEQAAAVPVAALTALQGLRDKGRLKRGGGRRHVELADFSDPLAALPDDLLDLDDALDRLAAAYPRSAELVNLRFFAGLTHEQASSALGISPSTADRDWRFAQAWLLRALGGD